jgi:hypothetical protein
LCEIPLQQITNNLASPGIVPGARWMHGGTGLPGQSQAMRQRLPTPNENGRAFDLGA